MDSSGLGEARLYPAVAYAGQKGQWTVEYVAGDKGIREGGGLRIIPPFCHDMWVFGKVIATCSNPDIYTEVVAERTWPVTYHHSNYPAITIVVYGGEVKPGDRIRIIMGALGGYVSGRFVQTTAQTHADSVAFRVLVDYKGNGRFARERTRPEAYEPCGGSLTLCVRPAAPARLRCSVRCRPAPGRGFLGVVAVEDRFENPISEGDCDIELRGASGPADLPVKVRKADGASGATFEVKLRDDSTPTWIEAHDWRRGIYGVSNPVCEDFGGRGDGIYFGDMHVMTGSCGNPHMCGSTEGALRYARDVFGLDFTAVTNSFSQERWPAEQSLFAAYNVDHEFVTIPGYELGWRTGHKNVYYADDQLPAQRASTLEALWEFLGDKDCMAISHHTNTHSETDRELAWGSYDLSTINPQFERLIEICQNRGSFELDQIGGEVSFGGFGSSVRDALALGYRLGFVGGTDTHRGRPGSRLSNQSGLDARANVTGGITAVLCRELTRAAVWGALNARRCYATTSVRILLDFELNGHVMGEDIAINAGNEDAYAVRRVRVRCAGTYPLCRLVIVRNGVDVFTQPFDEMTAEVVWEDDRALSESVDPGVGGVYYYAKLYQQDGNVAWTSPIWLTLSTHE